MSAKINKELKLLLADTYALYLKTQNYHWNVTGPHFSALHALFEVQYTDLAAAVDEIAERIRALGDTAPARFGTYSELTKIKDGDEQASASEMVKHLAEDQELLIKTLQNVLGAAQEEDDEVTIGLVVDRMSVHEKAGWMLRSSI